MSPHNLIHRQCLYETEKHCIIYIIIQTPLFNGNTPIIYDQVIVMYIYRIPKIDMLNLGRNGLKQCKNHIQELNCKRSRMQSRPSQPAYRDQSRSQRCLQSAPGQSIKINTTMAALHNATTSTTNNRTISVLKFFPRACHRGVHFSWRLDFAVYR